MKAITWQSIVTALTILVLFFDFVIKSTGKESPIISAFKWVKEKFKRKEDIRELMWKSLVKLEAIENEVKFNGGKYKLVDAVKDLQYSTGQIINTLAIQSSEREADMYVANIPMYKTEGASNVTFVNAAWCEMVGCTDYNRMLGHGWKQAVMPFELERYDDFEKLFTHDLVPFYGEYSFRHLVTKQEIKTMVRTQVIKDGNNKPIGTMGTITILS